MLFKYYTANVIESLDHGTTHVVGTRVWRVYRWRTPIYALQRILCELSGNKALVDFRRIK